MRSSDFPEVFFWQFSKILKIFFSRFPVSFFETVFRLDYVWRPQLTKNSNQSESSLFLGEFWVKKMGEVAWFLEWRHRGLKKTTRGRSFSFVINETRRKSESLELLTDVLEFVARKLWPKNHKLIS